MSALSKVEMSVSAPFWEFGAVISMGMVMMSKRELIQPGRRLFRWPRKQKYRLCVPTT